MLIYLLFWNLAYLKELISFGVFCSDKARGTCTGNCKRLHFSRVTFLLWLWTTKQATCFPSLLSFWNQILHLWFKNSQSLRCRLQNPVWRMSFSWALLHLSFLTAWKFSPIFVSLKHSVDISWQLTQPQRLEPHSNGSLIGECMASISFLSQINNCKVIGILWSSYLSHSKN